MSKRTGRPRGRPPGSKNKRGAALLEAMGKVERTMDLEIAERFENRGHALLKAIYQNEELDIVLRLDAAKAAIPYEKPRLAAVAVKVDDRQGFLPLWDWMQQHSQDASKLAEILADESESDDGVRH